jgi:elongation factor P hydroxylase
MKNNFNIQDLQIIFNKTFKSSYRTVLTFGADEPFYQTAKNKEDHHKIICRSDFFASALHEISHWCIAGEERRKKDDFGYWYNPDGRNLQEQALFEKFEVKPQALEWIFSQACSRPFKVSVDNLSLDEYDPSLFKEKVYAQVLEYKRIGLPGRAKDFAQSLEDYYGKPKESLTEDMGSI